MLGDDIRDQAELVNAMGGKKAGWYISADWPRLAEYIQSLETYYTVRSKQRSPEFWFLAGFWAASFIIAVAQWLSQ